MWRDYWAGREKFARGKGELLISSPVGGAVPPRPLTVYLPAGYRDGRDRFPLVVLQDGQNLFDDATAFAGAWRAERALDGLAASGHPVIAVGVPNAEKHRIHEYAPVKDKRYGVAGGAGGEAYSCYLVDSVLRGVEKSFRVRHDREAIGVAGASMGGLISLHAFFAWPERFGRVGAMSPSLFFGREALTRWIGRRPFHGGRIYLDIGTLEGRRNRKRRILPRFPSGAMRRLRKLRKVLEKKGFERGVDLEWIEESGGRHDEAAWARRLPGMLEFLYA